MNAPNRLPTVSVVAIDDSGSATLRARLAELVRLPGLDVQAGAGGLTGAAAQADVVLLHAADRSALAVLPARPGLAALAHDRPVVVACGEPDDAAETELLRLGIEAIVGDRDSAELARALRHAFVRKQLERTARTAYATDLATGLPHEAQLLEHMTQLIALREREPAPLVLIVLRVDGVAQAAARLGDEAANVLRRKIAVRLRGGLRASDVVASLGTDLYAVMLGRVDVAGDGDGVAGKLLRALEQPFVLAGQPCSVQAAFGLASYPAHGKDAARLLQRAAAQAAMVGADDGGGAQHSTFSVLGGAANDEPG
ncbi:MAG: GGDEF domain-containing protein [Betaproteobacteria bacterium]|nr:GGDEF domain-containing protein [Betaproteobacteria bacterium]MCC6248035.1 GGDEF domain-containing protein [Rubrivivax sp.]